MRLLIADECNLTWDDKFDFFVYGGIVINEQDIKPLAEELLGLKKKSGIEKIRPIKWTNNKWKGSPVLDSEIHADIKTKVLDLIASTQSKIIVCLSPQVFYHKVNNDYTKMVIDPETQKRTQEYALNDVLEKFNWFLEEEGELGMVLADNFGDSLKSHMHEHCVGLFPKSTLDRIVHPVIQLDNQHSYLHQINDVVLGAIYYSLREMELNLLPKLKDSFWMGKSGSSYPDILEKGFTVYPQLPRRLKLAENKKNLQKKFLRLISSV